MFKFKSTLIALTILFICISYVSNSYAFEIVEMDPADGSSIEVYYDSWYDYLPHGASLSTDEPYYAVSWYVDGVYVGTNEGGKPEDTEAYYGFSNLTGSRTGTTYIIRAEALSIGTAENPSVLDTATYTLTVYTFEILEIRPGGGLPWERPSIPYEHVDNIPHHAYVLVSEPYHYVKLYVDGEYYDTYYGYEEYPNLQQAWFTVNGLTGAPCGTDYTITAIAFPWTGAPSAAASYTLTVYETTNTGVTGCVEVSSIGWEDIERPFDFPPHKGNYASAYAWLYNRTDESKRYTIRFSYSVVRINPNDIGRKHATWISTEYSADPIFIQGDVAKGEPVNKSFSDSHTSVRRNNGWNRNDVFRVQALISLEVNNLDDFSVNDKWEDEDFSDFRVPEDDF